MFLITTQNLGHLVVIDIHEVVVLFECELIHLLILFRLFLQFLRVTILLLLFVCGRLAANLPDFI